MLTDDWVNLTRPPGARSLSEPPGTSDMYLSPSRLDDTISATVSSGSLSELSTLIRTVARNVLRSRVNPSTEPTLMPLILHVATVANPVDMLEIGGEPIARAPERSWLVL